MQVEHGEGIDVFVPNLIAATAAAVAVMLVALSSPAFAGVYKPAGADNPRNAYRNDATGRCLDDSTAYGNDVLRGYPCLGNEYQNWVELPY